MTSPFRTGRSISWCIPLDSKKLTLSQAAVFGMLGALTYALKTAMAFLPNIEPVSLMVMLFAVVFGKKAFYPITVYVAMEYLHWGISLWSLPYLYIWGLLAFAAYRMRKATHPLAWALLSGVFGLAFGALCTPVCIATGGWAYALSWWISGIPYDIPHCIGNFVLALLLFSPLRSILSGLYKKI